MQSHGGLGNGEVSLRGPSNHGTYVTTGCTGGPSGPKANRESDPVHAGAQFSASPQEKKCLLKLLLTKASLREQVGAQVSGRRREPGGCFWGWLSHQPAVGSWALPLTLLSCFPHLSNLVVNRVELGQCLTRKISRNPALWASQLST